MKSLKDFDAAPVQSRSPGAGSVDALKDAAAALRRPASLKVAEHGLKAAQDRREECADRLAAAIQRNLELPDAQRDHSGRAVMALQAELRQADQAVNAAALSLAAERAAWEPTFRAFLLHFQAQAGRDIVAAIELIDAALPVLRACEDQLLRNGMQPRRRLVAPELDYLRELAGKFAEALP